MNCNISNGKGLKQALRINTVNYLIYRITEVVTEEYYFMYFSTNYAYGGPAGI